TTPAFPDVPQNVVATGAAQTRIDLTWDAAAGATCYRVYESTTTGGPYTWIGAPTTNSFSLGGLSPGSTHYFVVGSFSSTAGLSAASAEASATTPTATPAPLNLAASAASSTQINVTWSAVSGATSYRLFRSPTHGGPYDPVVWTTNPTYANGSLTTGTDYYYVVVAYSSTSGFSPNSTEAHARPATCSDPVVSGTTATVTCPVGSSRWTPPAGVTSVNVDL